ncbi:MAG: hypothetical protein IJY88_03265 [Clostridia bacterium]|nr:hypothetical protein [Clostridia bacterium]
MPLVAVLFYIIKVAVERSLAKKSLPISSREYLSLGYVDAEDGTVHPMSEKPARKSLRESIAEWREKRKSKKEDNGENK